MAGDGTSEEHLQRSEPSNDASFEKSDEPSGTWTVTFIRTKTRNSAVTMKKTSTVKYQKKVIICWTTSKTVLS